MFLRSQKTSQELDALERSRQNGEVLNAVPEEPSTAGGVAVSVNTPVDFGLPATAVDVGLNCRLIPESGSGLSAAGIVVQYAMNAAATAIPRAAHVPGSNFCPLPVGRFSAAGIVVRNAMNAAATVDPHVSIPVLNRIAHGGGDQVHELDQECFGVAGIIQFKLEEIYTMLPFLAEEPKLYFQYWISNFMYSV